MEFSILVIVDQNIPVAPAMQTVIDSNKKLFLGMVEEDALQIHEVLTQYTDRKNILLVKTSTHFKAHFIQYVLDELEINNVVIATLANKWQIIGMRYYEGWFHDLVFKEKEFIPALKYVLQSENWPYTYCDLQYAKN